MPVPPAPAARSRRDPFFDAVRAFAIVRVVAWHTLQWPALSYVAAMPVMFFVGGVLARGSFQGRGAATVLRKRLARLLPPLWAYGAVAWVMFALGGAAIDARSIVWWIVPLWDPTGPDQAVAWWAPLWYLRAYLWLLLLTPLLLAALRRAGAAVTLSVLTALAFGVAIAADAGAGPRAQLRDLALYGAFWGFGVATPRLRARWGSIRPGWRGLGALAFAGAAAACLVTWPAPLGIVNASPVAELLLGAAWLLGLSALAGPITKLASQPAIGRAVVVLNRRAMSTYLWHAGAIALSFAALDSLGVRGTWRTPALAVLVALTTIALVTAAGPIEDLTATRRRIGSLRYRVAAGAGAIPCLLAAATLLPVAQLQNAEGAYVPASGRGLDRLIEIAAADDDGWVQPSGPVRAGELDTLLAEWRDRWDISGVVVAIGRSDGSVWRGAGGVDEATGEDMSVHQSIPAHSITKSFTGALVAQLHSEGVIDVDQPLSVWVPEFPHSANITLRQLAQHTSGLVDTGEEPATALQIAGAEPLLFAPGEDSRYTDSAYYLLGLVVERATGGTYEDALSTRLLVPLALDSTSLSNPDRWSAGGVTTTVGDLATWAPTYWGGALGEGVAAQAMTLDPDNNFGLGTFGYCPCRGLGPFYRADLYGHLSAQGRLAWDPADDLAVMLHTNEHNDGRRVIDAWTELDRLLRRQVEGRPFAAPDLTTEPAEA
jgi:CubicO group peptidase (beta-lactamase class C family)/peptidoglycan/LPS O-acetylase OafA/YrhL